MQIDRQKFQQSTIEVRREGGSFPKPAKRSEDRDAANKPAPRKLHPKAYEDAERWDGMS